MRSSMLCSAALCALALAACTETPDPEFPAPGPYGDPAQPVATAPTPGGALPSATTPGAGPTTPAASGQPAAVPPALVVGLQPVLKAMVGRDVRNMREDGAPAAAQLAAGQTFETPITLQPGRCYTAVGVGVGITELDLEIVIAQPPAPEYVAASDNDAGYKAVVAEAPNCFRNPLPFAAPAKLRARAVSGSGPAIVQLYVR